MHRDFNRPETQSRAVSSDGSVNVVLEPLDTETIVTHEEFYHYNSCFIWNRRNALMKD